MMEEEQGRMGWKHAFGASSYDSAWRRADGSAQRIKGNHTKGAVHQGGSTSRSLSSGIAETHVGGEEKRDLAKA
jgi:hypothetical protein